MLRNDGRTYDQVRPLKIEYDSFGYADSSVLLNIGETKVLVSINLQNGVPNFLRGKGTGWLTCEYSMLPSSTRTRSSRDSSLQKRNSRSVEISRLIGRSFRSVVDTSALGERTVVIDCDVLQADGGTRCASITAAGLALNIANQRWLDAGIIKKNFVRESIAAISVGIVDKHIYLDLSQQEDSRAHADFNFVLTKSGNIIEIQGTSEKQPISWENFDQLRKLALEGIEQIFEVSKTLEPEKRHCKNIFTLGNRIG